MIQLTKINFGDSQRWYLLFGRTRLPSVISLDKTEAIQTLDRAGRREVFLYRPLDALVKVKLDKYTFLSHPLRWLGRVVIQERLFLQVNSRKEYRGNKAYRDAGLKPVKAFAWGVALNPFNSWGSVYFMEYCRTATNGKIYFDHAVRDKKLELVDRLISAMVALVKSGYYNRDQHFNNVMIDENEVFIWIDTHVSRLPRGGKRGMRTVIENASRKMPTIEFKKVARDILEQKLGQ